MAHDKASRIKLKEEKVVRITLVYQRKFKSDFHNLKPLKYKVT